MSFTEEQTAFRDSIRRMVAKHVAPIAAEIDETDRFPTELVKLFGEMGLMQLWVPEQYGGPNGNLTMANAAASGSGGGGRGEHGDARVPLVCAERPDAAARDERPHRRADPNDGPI